VRTVQLKSGTLKPDDVCSLFLVTRNKSEQSDIIQPPTISIQGAWIKLYGFSMLTITHLYNNSTHILQG
jgi:hypothetical protein